ncbi:MULTISPECIES: sigma-54-dependent Fis family transcriptional regulator [Stenotrophomonas]|uniref:Sigma-54-dependent Fis family transcriptional regulator n=3 Tax=Stenotrophomonas TaxID=40323 RepID=A0A4S2CX62_STEMA|nr:MULTISPECIES: sigma-54-dependent Fis family transcriptional regulator [Stenotrophomonas]TGY33195.1 sigma-54-dependent Fis family transcriptional regulator [Stenotrophomonas maltophilia]
MSQLPLQHRVGNARRSFFERGAAPIGIVPDTILQSWQRCLRGGLSVHAQPDVAPLPDARLRELRQRQETLWRLARPELDGLAADIAVAGSIVLLTDEAGWILDAEGSPDFLDKAGRVALMPGVRWDETSVGTNAIGTAIVEGRSVEVRGGEHYFAPHGILTCSATPIFDPYGQRVGVLDISGDARLQHLHARVLARQAVAHIEHRYFDAGLGDCEVVRLHHDAALLGTAREGVLGFRGGRLVAANRAGLALFGLEHGDLGRASYEALFDVPLSRLHDDGALIDRQGRALYGHLGQPPARRSPAAATRMPVAAPARVSASAPRLDPSPLFDAAQQQALARACRVLDAQLPVLLQGETGTGKEVFARALHRRSTRADKPFVAVNCAALPEGLIEAELFGYEEGAFTGARKTGNTGLLRQAQGGVLFLDEIGDMPLALQPRLLRVLQERTLSPLGGGKPVQLDFALICATHRDLDEAMAAGTFRSDLYYRIADHCVALPPLRAHPDRAALVRGLWERLGEGRQLEAVAFDALAAYAWPGNVRQLSACLRTLVALSDPGQVLGHDDLPSYLRDAPRELRAEQAGVPDRGLDAIETDAMRDALARCGGNVAQAARLLGISRSTLYRRVGNSARRRH